ncbi:(d)CMP kinase [Candidatus Dependentiae bacterium]|nr:(d)CMP kinase [Candidatus Dependentiae bacterium]MBU4387511.1 (d)CMP kinase [Candidatus Dependentiae bacterium]MCG2756794.1 (d)CMP kinase [Candidatus Dependentiae bacterium]
MIITIDGPAGSGKSSIAKTLAEKLNIYYLNTGLLYRAVAYVWLQTDPKLENINKINSDNLKFIKNIEYKYLDKLPQIFYQNKNITDQLLNNSISQAASILSSIETVRAELLDLQRIVAKTYNIVCEGRDCGSIIFPDADYKFYLTATLDVRAKRIFEDKGRKDNDVSLGKVKEELEIRDKRDQARKIAPLVIPNGAVIIDNSEFSKEETLFKILFYIKNT